MLSTFLMISASWPRCASSQKTAGDPVARALVTASFTQFWIGASLTWHILKMSPTSTACSRTVAPVASTTRIVPSAGASKVLSWEPYSSAFCAIRPTLATLPMVAGSNWPFLFASSRISAYMVA